jgi:hypothetical protein
MAEYLVCETVVMWSCLELCAGESKIRCRPPAKVMVEACRSIGGSCSARLQVVEVAAGRSVRGGGSPFLRVVEVAN